MPVTKHDIPQKIKSILAGSSFNKSQCQLWPSRYHLEMSTEQGKFAMMKKNSVHVKREPKFKKNR